MLFKYNFTIAGCVRKKHTIDIELEDFNGSRRTYSLALDYDKHNDPRWEEVDKLYDEGNAIDAYDLSTKIMKDYES